MQTEALFPRVGNPADALSLAGTLVMSSPPGDATNLLFENFSIANLGALALSLQNCRSDDAANLRANFPHLIWRNPNDFQDVAEAVSCLGDAAQNALSTGNVGFAVEKARIGANILSALEALDEGFLCIYWPSVEDR